MAVHIERLVPGLIDIEEPRIAVFIAGHQQTVGIKRQIRKISALPVRENHAGAVEPVPRQPEMFVPQFHISADIHGRAVKNDGFAVRSAERRRARSGKINAFGDDDSAFVIGKARGCERTLAALAEFRNRSGIIGGDKFARFRIRHVAGFVFGDRNFVDAVDDFACRADKRQDCRRDGGKHAKLYLRHLTVLSLFQFYGIRVSKYRSSHPSDSNCTACAKVRR